MSFDESLFILPNEESNRQAGGNGEPFTFVFYDGSDSLKNYPKLDKPYVLVKKPSNVETVETLERFTESTGLIEDDILAVNADAFLKILESPGLGGGLETHLFFSPNKAVALDIKQILGEQVLFIATFHELHFLACINKLAVPYLNTSINERYDVVRDLLTKEQTSTGIFGIPLKDIQAYYTEIQTEYVGKDERRIKSLSDILDLISKEPKDIIAYFSEGRQYYADELPDNAASMYTASTRRGFNNISLHSNNFNNAGSVVTQTGVEAAVPTLNTVPTVPTVTTAPTATKVEPSFSVVEPSFSVVEPSVSVVVPTEQQEESKEGEEQQNNNSVATSATGEPASVSASNVSVSIPTNARASTAQVPAKAQVKPPSVPAPRNIKNITRSRRNALQKQREKQSAMFKGQQNMVTKAISKTRRLSKAARELKQAKEARTGTNNSHIATYGNPENEEVSNNETGYNTSRAVVGEVTDMENSSSQAKSSRKVRMNPTTTLVNTSGLQELARTKPGKK